MLRWFDKKPLFGTRVLVTRARAQASELIQKIEELGGEPCEYPVIETRDVTEAAQTQAIERALDEAESFDWLMFTSVNGVESFFRWLRRYGTDIRRFGRARIAAVGPKTAEALLERGLTVEELPGKYMQEGLLEQLSGEVQPGQRALLARGDLARKVLPSELRALGVDAVELDVYETVIADRQDELALEQLRDGDVHVVTFTSSSTVTNLMTLLKANGVEDPVALLKQTQIASIGPITTQAVKAAGLEVAIEPEEATIEALVAAIVAKRLADRTNANGVNVI